MNTYLGRTRGGSRARDRGDVVREMLDACGDDDSEVRALLLTELRRLEAATHTIKWYGVSAGVRIPRTSAMRGRDWGWDATCSCGWDSRTGGAIQERIREAIQLHKWDAERGYAL